MYLLACLLLLSLFYNTFLREWNLITIHINALIIYNNEINSNRCVDCTLNYKGMKEHFNPLWYRCFRLCLTQRGKCSTRCLFRDTRKLEIHSGGSSRTQVRICYTGNGWNGKKAKLTSLKSGRPCMVRLISNLYNCVWCCVDHIMCRRISSVLVLAALQMCGPIWGTDVSLNITWSK